MLWSLWYRTRNRLRSSLWTIPIVAIPFAMAATRALHWLDAKLQWTFLGFGVPGAQAMLQAIITATLSFMVFTFGSLLICHSGRERYPDPRVTWQLDSTARQGCTKSCLVGIEACASSHHWSRELQALGHSVRLMPPAYVKPYVKRHKNDATDAEAICEAVTRPNMRFVATKTTEQQSCLTLHRTRHLFIRQQTSVINVIRAHLAEFGIVAPVGRNGVEQLLGMFADGSDKRLPEIARACVAALGTQLRVLKAQILQFDRMIMAWHRSSEASRRLDDIPGIGPALATALVAASPMARRPFRSGRDFSGLGSG